MPCETATVRVCTRSKIASVAVTFCATKLPADSIEFRTAETMSCMNDCVEMILKAVLEATSDVTSAMNVLEASSVEATAATFPVEDARAAVVDARS